MNKIVRLFATGFAMGSADIVPGVSGGTLAFILGVYEELIYSIKKATGETLKLALQFKIKKAFETVPFGFLLPLGAGIVTAVILLSSFLEHQLEENPLYVWSFFFGLIVASIWIVKGRVKKWTQNALVFMAFFAGIAYVVAGLVPVETPATILLFFFSGMIAIIAMILPGVSGSFLLVLMGKYEQILSAVNERDILTLGVVLLGAAVGIAVFSRILSWLFENHHDIAVASLTGFMIGSLRKIWPWKVGEANIFPELNSEVLIPLLLMVFAAWAMISLEKFADKSHQAADIEDKDFKKFHKKATKK